MQVLQIVSGCSEDSQLHVMKTQAQQLFSTTIPADDLPTDIPDLGTLGNYLLTRWASCATSWFIINIIINICASEFL